MSILYYRDNRISCLGVFVMFDKKKAFSYIELLFGMVIVVVIFSASVPFITKKSQSQPALPGAFACFSAYDDNFGDFRLFQTMQRGTENFTELIDVTDVGGCVFYQQKNTNNYNVTIIGGGGAANKLVNDRVTLGEDGQTIQIPNTTLAGVWDENNALVVRHCRNSGLKNAVVPYEKEHDYCVGKGGASHRRLNLGSTEQDEQTYTELLGVYHDLLYEAKTNIDTVTYVGLGNGVLDEDDLNALNILNNSADKTNIINGIDRYLGLGVAARASVAEKERLFELAKRLRALISNNSYTATGNHGGQGGYSRFVIYDKHPLECLNGFGDCVARGGIGGGFDGTNVITANPDNGEAVNSMLADIRASITEGVADKTVLQNNIGHAGRHGSLVVREIPRETIVRELNTPECVKKQSEITSAYNEYINHLFDDCSFSLSKGFVCSGNLSNKYYDSYQAKVNEYESMCKYEERIVDYEYAPGDSPVANGGAIIISW